MVPHLHSLAGAFADLCWDTADVLFRREDISASSIRPSKSRRELRPPRDEGRESHEWQGT